MTSIFLIAFAGSLVVSFGLADVIRRLATRWGVLDHPAEDPERKIHPRPIPLLGGSAAIVSFFLTLFIVHLIRPTALSGISAVAYIAVGIASGLLLLGGALDDRFRLSPGRQIIWPVLAGATVILGGVGIRFISNPFGGLIYLDQTTLSFGVVAGVTIGLTLWADLFSFAWLLGMTYTTKFLDGLDGLVAGVTAIGGFVVFFVSLRPDVNQPTTALLALCLAGSLLGLLPLNFHPARLFLGEAGALWSGFMLGVLAIISGGKIATALLLLGIPILDVAWVIIRRLRERRSPFRTADRKHLHFRLLDVGFSHRGAVLLLYALTLVFGLSTLFFHGWRKLAVLVVLVLVMIGLGTSLVTRSREPNG